MSDENVREMWSDDELDAALAAFRSDVDTDDRVLRDTRSGLLAAAPAADEGGQDVRPAAFASPRPRWVIAAAAAAAVIVVVAGVLVAVATRPGTGDGTGTGPTASSRPQSPVDRIKATDEPLRPGQFRYFREHQWWSTYGEGSVWKSEYVYERWMPAQVRQRWMERRETTGRAVILAGDAEQSRAIGMGPSKASVEVYRAPCGDYFAGDRKPCEYQGSWEHPNQEFLAALPRDPDELLAQVRALVADATKLTPDYLAFKFLSDVLRETGWAVPADLRMALYRAIAKLPTVDIAENVPNLNGRKGTAFAVSDSYKKWVMIVDPATGRVIGERCTVVTAHDGLEPGTEYSDSAIDVVVVDGMGVRSAG